MIEKLSFVNFQSHAKTILELDQVTTVVGPSDLGKTALIRGLRWLSFNRPNNSRFIKHHKSFCRVSAVVDGTKVSRRKGKKGNYYDLDKYTYKAVGTKVPEDVSNLLGVGDINFQNQLEPHFWFSLSPGQVSKRLDEIMDLQLIDAVLSETAARLRRSRASVEEAKDRIDEARREKMELSWASKANKKLAVLEQMQSDLQFEQNEIDHLENMVDSLEEHSAELSTQQAALESLDELQELGEQAESMAGDCERLAELVEYHAGESSSLKDRREALRELESKIKKELKGKCPLCHAPMKSLP